jgi:hypothetical protein
MDAGVQHRRQHLGGRRRRSGAATGDPVQANGKSSAQLSRGQGLSNTSAVRHDEKRLLAADLLVT